MSTLGVGLLAALVALVVTGLLYQWRGTRADARTLPPPGQLIDVGGGRRLHVLCLAPETAPDDARPGASVSVIFEAGLAASSLNWRPVQEHVARFARACAYDRAGYGWSDRAAGPRSARVSGADLHRLLHAAGIPPPYLLVAHSFGCYVAPLFAAEYPAEVAGLVLVDPIVADDWLAPDAAQRRMLMGGRLFSRIGAALASVGLVRFLLNRFQRERAALAAGDVSVSVGVGPRAGTEAEAPPHDGQPADPDIRPGARRDANRASLPAAVLGLFGRDAASVVRRILGEITKMPRDLWPSVQAHWSRPASFLTMAQHFQALPPSAAELKAAVSWTPQPSPVLPRSPAASAPADASAVPASSSSASASRAENCLRDIPLVVVSGAHCTDERLRCHRALANLSTAGTHLHATIGGHWVHLDEPQLVADAIRELVQRTPASA